ncbi:MAG: hypothetical protein PWP08_1135 [Methanofollis sp.]|nr:hypothetical protein [Methanofollis sp.]
MVAKPQKRTPETKKSGKKTKTQIAMLVFGVLFAVAMVASYLTPAMSAFKSVQPGDSVTFDYTVRDAAGVPVLTTSQTALVDTYNSGQVGFLTSQMTLVAGENASSRVTPVAIYLPDGTTAEFALLESEVNDLTTGILGMHEREVKTIPLTLSDLPEEIDATGADQMGINFTEAQVGDRFTIAMTITDDPTIFTDPTNQIPYIRVGMITGKTNDTLSVNFGYSTADVTVSKITQA